MSTPSRKIPIDAQFINDESNIIILLDNNRRQVVAQLNITANQIGRVRLSKVSDMNLKIIDNFQVHI
jgi:hypothetical protein